MRLRFNILLVLLPFGCIAALRAEPVDVQHIVEQSVLANKADWKAEPDYDYCERVQKDGHSKVFDVRMILGSPYHVLTAVDSQPLPSQAAAEENRKLQQEIATRRSESPDQRARRIADWRHAREQEHLLEDQLTRAFDFKYSGKTNLHGHETYLLTATPKRGYEPPNRDAKVLTGMRGKLWIDQDSFQWVKVEADVIHPVSVEGFLARVEPGTRFELDQAPVTPDVWLPAYFAEKAHARIFFVLSKNSQEEDTYFDYRKPSSEAAREKRAPGCH